jgi:O-antigen ligase
MTSLAFALKGPMPFATVVGVAGGGATLVYSLVPKDIFKRLAEGTQADTFQIRMRLWKAGLQYFTEHPFIGSGVGNFRAAVSPRIAETIVAHNTFIELLAEEGIIGFTIMCAFWLMLGRMVYLMRREDRLFWATVFLVWAVCVSTLSWEFNKSTWFIYACLMAHFSTIQTRKQRAELAKAKAAA